MSLKTRTIIYVLILNWALVIPGAAFAFTVSGTITDAGGMALNDIRVQVRNDNIIGSTLIEEVFTNAAGLYTTSAAVAGHDVFLRVTWEFPLRELTAPNLGSRAFYNNKFVKVDEVKTAAGPPVVIVPFTQVQSPVSDDITGNITINLVMTNTFPNPDGNAATNDQRTMVLHINQALDFYRSNGGTVAWNPDYDVPVNLDATQIGSSALDEINLATVDITGTGNGRVSDIYHELGHLVHYRFNGDSLPPSNCPCHTSVSETGEECAIVEGWASYMAVLASQNIATPGLPIDGKYNSNRDCLYSNWRGSKVLARGPNGACNFGPIDTGFDNSGEIVEGAVGGFFYHWSTGRAPTANQCTLPVASATRFAENFKAMHDNDDINGFFDFRAKLVTNSGGSGTPKTKDIYETAQKHGIVFTRARLQTPLTNLFDEDDPPNDAASMEAGNAKLIEGEVHLRGTVTVNMDEVPKADLKVLKTVDLDEIRLDWRAANDGTADSPIFPNSTPFANFGLTNDDVALDTTIMGLPNGDGQWDLLAVGKNAHGAEDKLTPSWIGDVPNPGPTDSDEKYFKLIGSWFDFDRDPATNTNPGGRVTVDNEPPIADPTEFKPQ